MRKPPSVNDHFNFHSDGMRSLEGKIDWLVKSNHQILSILRALEYKINQTLDAPASNVDTRSNPTSNVDIRSTKHSSIDLMDHMEVMNLLNNIHQFIVSSNSGARQNDILKADQIQVIKDFVSAIQSEKKHTGHMTPSASSNSVKQVSV